MEAMATAYQRHKKTQHSTALHRSFTYFKHDLKFICNPFVYKTIVNVYQLNNINSHHFWLQSEYIYNVSGQHVLKYYATFN